MERIAILDRPSARYRDDVAAWADEQAALLRAGRLGEVDLRHVIEEIEGVSASQRSALASQIARIVEHLLKLIYSPAIEPRAGWLDSIDDGRAQIRRLLDDSPSLRRELGTIVDRNAVHDARIVVRKLGRHGELDRERSSAILGHRFSTDEVVSDWLPLGVDLGR